MKLADVAVATMTKVRDAKEERLVTAALTRLAATGMPIAVSDGGSSERFVERIRTLPGVMLVPPRGAGLVAQVQAAIRAAYTTRRPYILYTEPDKRRFFQTGLLEFVRRARADQRAGIQLASRSARAFGTFPAVQRLTEKAASELCAAVVGLEADYFYGPFLMARDLAPEVEHASLALGWGWRPFLFATAHRLGHGIRAFAGDYRCPRDQRVEHAGDQQHRIRQLVQNAQGLFAAMCFDHQRRTERAGARGGTR